MGGGDRYPYPKAVWSPAGGWWVQPKSWKSNSAVAAVAIGVIAYATFNATVSKEERYLQPRKWIPSQLWSDVKIGGNDS